MVPPEVFMVALSRADLAELQLGVLVFLMIERSSRLLRSQRNSWAETRGC
jgi:hypothetical protein